MMLTAYREGPDEQVWVLKIPDADIVRAKLDRIDRKFLAECDGPDATISDRLLGLETLVRRIEEASMTACPSCGNTEWEPDYHGPDEMRVDHCTACEWPPGTPMSPDEWRAHPKNPLNRKD